MCKPLIGNDVTGPEMGHDRATLVHCSNWVLHIGSSQLNLDAAAAATVGTGKQRPVQDGKPKPPSVNNRDYSTS